MKGPFPRLFTKEERAARLALATGPFPVLFTKEERDARRWELYPEHGCPEWQYNLKTNVGPIILKALERLASMAVRLIANDLTKSGAEKHAYATDLVLDLAGTSRDDVAGHAEDLVHAAFDAARDAGEL